MAPYLRPGLATLAIVVALALFIGGHPAIAWWVLALGLVLSVRAVGEFIGRTPTNEAFAKRLRFEVVGVAAVGFASFAYGVLLLTGVGRSGDDTEGMVVGVICLAGAPLSVYVLRKGFATANSWEDDDGSD